MADQDAGPPRWEEDVEGGHFSDKAEFRPARKAGSWRWWEEGGLLAKHRASSPPRPTIVGDPGVNSQGQPKEVKTVPYGCGYVFGDCSCPKITIPSL